MVGKNILPYKIIENYFSENQIFKNCIMQFGYDYCMIYFKGL